MMQREYHIKIYSIGRFVVAFSVALSLSIILLTNHNFHIENKIFSILLFLGIFATSFYVALLVGTAKAKIIFTEEAFIHIWEKNFFFSTGRDIKIPWCIIINYVFEEDRNFDRFIINLTTNKRYKINKFTMIPIKDDFNKLVKDFPKLANEYMKKSISDNDITANSDVPLIYKGESFYASRHFRWIFYFMTVIFFVLLLTKMFNSESSIRWSSLGLIGCGLLFYGFKMRH